MSNVEILTLRSFLVSEQCPGPSSRCDQLSWSYAWNYRELATLPTLSDILAEGGLEPLNIESMGKNITTELSLHRNLLWKLSCKTRECNVE